MTKPDWCRVCGGHVNTKTNKYCIDRGWEPTCFPCQRGKTINAQEKGVNYFKGFEK